ncbi:MAG: hypothetical protein LBF54_02165 [Holosporaceae bacterium]|jgi:hypothetical protein|nr:hypothetical protein [Holosporaceae bacterium]
MKRLSFLLFLLRLCVFADSQYFEVRDIEIKQKGKNSLAAKQVALDRAARLALKKMIEDELKGSFPESISNQQIQNCVYDYSIDQEKFSDSIYIGRISYRFLKNKISSLLKPHGINVSIQDDEGKANDVRLSVYLVDFLRRARELRKIKAAVEKFSDQKVVFRIKKKYIDDFRKLRIKYARLI